MLFSVGIMAQEKREYKQINETTVEVAVYYDDVLTQKGTMRIHDGKWVPCGTWYGYNSKGELIMTAEFKGGRKLWFEALRGDRVVAVDYTRSKRK